MGLGISSQFAYIEDGLRQLNAFKEAMSAHSEGSKIREKLLRAVLTDAQTPSSIKSSLFHYESRAANFNQESHLGTLGEVKSALNAEVELLQSILAVGLPREFDTLISPLREVFRAQAIRDRHDILITQLVTTPVGSKLSELVHTDQEVERVLIVADWLRALRG